jgi:N-acetylmuramoyl-L-alanine amidase
VRLISEEALAEITLKMEAEGEPYAGKLAVAWVIRNRMADNFFSDGTVSGTVLRAAQFSGWNTASPERIRCVRLDPSVSQADADCVRAWAESGSGGEDPTQGAVQYYNPAIVTPSWASGFEETVVIGGHRFMKQRA